LLQHETADFITADLWRPNSPDLNPVDYRMYGVLRERVYRKYNLLKLNADELKLRLIEAWFGIQQNVADQAMTNGEFTLMHVSKPKENILKTCFMMCCSTTVNNLL